MSFDSADILVRVVFWVAVMALSLHPEPLAWLRGVLAPRRAAATA